MMHLFFPPPVLGVVSFVFQMLVLVFSRSDPISFADVATCDWLHKLSDLKKPSDPIFWI